MLTACGDAVEVVVVGVVVVVLVEGVDDVVEFVGGVVEVRLDALTSKYSKRRLLVSCRYRGGFGSDVLLVCG